MSIEKAILLNNEVMVRKDGFFQIEKDAEAVREFEKEVQRKSVKFDSYAEKVHWMVSNDYYYNVFEQYTEDQVVSIFEKAHGYGFHYKSYMAASKFYSDYAVKTNDKKKYLETYPDRVAIASLYLGRGSIKSAERHVHKIMNGFQPATPTFLNAGKSRRGEMISCFLLELDDSLNSINFNISTAMQLSKIGGGVALNLSKLRGRGEAIKGVEGAAKGIMPVMKLLEDAFSYADQMGQRKGAGAVYYNIFGWDVIEFLDTKKINADEKSRIQSLSIGLIVPNKFFELAEKDEEFAMFAPGTVYKEYGIHLDDMDIDKMYDKLLKNKKIKRKTMSAREMLNKIAQTQFESGYPYIMFKTNANKFHPLKDIGQIKMSNLCTEIFQLQNASTINDYGVDDEIGLDVNCTLASLDIVQVMEDPEKDFRGTVHLAVESLSNVSDMTTIENAPSIKRSMEEFHAIGLGAMNLHGMLAKYKIPYESKDAIDFVRAFFMMLNFYSIEKSCLISKETGIKFKDFEKSEYAKGTYFAMYLNEDFSPKTDKVKKIFEGFHIPTKEDWLHLSNEVKAYGMYNAYRLAIAPTQSISYVRNATSSVMPIVDQIETRTYANSTTYYPMPFLSKDNVFLFKSAYNINQFKLIDLVAEIQRHVDQGISTILYVDSNTSTSDLSRYYIYANKKGLKSLYYTRTKALSVEECTSCAV